MKICPARREWLGTVDRKGCYFLLFLACMLAESCRPRPLRLATPQPGACAHTRALVLSMFMCLGCTCVQSKARRQLQESCPLQESCLPSLKLGLQLTYNSPNKTSLASQQAQESSCLYLSSARIAGTYHHAQQFYTVAEAGHYISLYGPNHPPVPRAPIFTLPILTKLCLL